MSTMHRCLAVVAIMVLWSGAASSQVPFGGPVDIIGRPQPSVPSPPLSPDSSPAPSAAPSPRPSQRVATELARAFDQVQFLGVISVAPEELAARTLEGLKQIDPAFAIRRSDKEISVYHNGALAVRAAPAKTSDWQSTLEKAIDGAVAVSPAAQAAPPLDLAAALVNAMVTPFGTRVRHLAPAELRPMRPLPPDATFGAAWERRGDRLVVRGVEPDGSAARMKIEPGDAILEIDDTPVSRLSDAALSELLSRPITRRMTMHLARVDPKLGSRIALYGSSPTFGVTIGNDVLLIRYHSFAREPSMMMVAAVDALRAAPRAPVGIVLDLRSNAGGTLDASVALASIFLEPGPVATVVGNKDTPEQRFAAKTLRGTDRALQTLPLVVLVNAETASGAEIVAGALQLRGRAVIVGTATRAVGEIDTIVPLAHQLGAVRFTTGMVFLPPKYPLHGVGVAPNVCLSGVAASDARRAVTAGLRTMEPFGGRPRAQLTADERMAARAACPGSPREAASDLVVADHLARSVSDYRRALDSVPANPLTVAD